MLFRSVNPIQAKYINNLAAARAYIEQMWAEAMTIYRSGKYKLSFSIEMNRYLNAHQQDFMQEDTQAGMIYAYLEDYTGDRVCSKQLYEEALSMHRQLLKL